MCGPTITSLPEQRRLENIVSPARRQRPAHEHAIRQAKQSPKFPDGIQQQHAGRHPHPALLAKPRPPHISRSPAASSLPATTSNRSGLRGTSIRKTPRMLAPRRDHRVVFIHPLVRHRAGRDPHLGRPRAFDQLHHRRPRIRRPRREIVLQISAHRDPLRAQRQEALPHLLRLRQNRIHRGQHHRKHASQPQVLGQGLVRNSPVDHRQSRAGAMHLAEQIRPDLRLRHHHQRRLQRAKHAPHREHIIHRREKDSVGQCR